MNFNLSIPPNGSYSGDWLPILLPAVFVVWLIVWLLSLALALTRPDFDPITRLTWIVVLVSVPFFGLILYWAIAPQRPRRTIDTSNDLAGTPWENNPGHTTKRG